MSLRNLSRGTLFQEAIADLISGYLEIILTSNFNYGTFNARLSFSAKYLVFSCININNTLSDLLTKFRSRHLLQDISEFWRLQVVRR
jgi:hypothetical protein